MSSPRTPSSKRKAFDFLLNSGKSTTGTQGIGKSRSPIHTAPTTYSSSSSSLSSYSKRYNFQLFSEKNVQLTLKNAQAALRSADQTLQFQHQLKQESSQQQQQSQQQHLLQNVLQQSEQPKPHFTIPAQTPQQHMLSKNQPKGNITSIYSAYFSKEDNPSSSFQAPPVFAMTSSAQKRPAIKRITNIHSSISPSRPLNLTQSPSQLQSNRTSENYFATTTMQQHRVTTTMSGASSQSVSSLSQVMPKQNRPAHNSEAFQPFGNERDSLGFIRDPSTDYGKKHLQQVRKQFSNFPVEQQRISLLVPPSNQNVLVLKRGIHYFGKGTKLRSKRYDENNVILSTFEKEKSTARTINQEEDFIEEKNNLYEQTYQHGETLASEPDEHVDTSIDRRSPITATTTTTGAAIRGQRARTLATAATPTATLADDDKDSMNDKIQLNLTETEESPVKGSTPSLVYRDGFVALPSGKQLATPTAQAFQAKSRSVPHIHSINLRNSKLPLNQDGKKMQQYYQPKLYKGANSAAALEGNDITRSYADDSDSQLIVHSNLNNQSNIGFSEAITSVAASSEAVQIQRISSIPPSMLKQNPGYLSSSPRGGVGSSQHSLGSEPSSKRRLEQPHEDRMQGNNVNINHHNSSKVIIEEDPDVVAAAAAASVQFVQVKMKQKGNEEEEINLGKFVILPEEKAKLEMQKNEILNASNSSVYFRWKMNALDEAQLLELHRRTLIPKQPLPKITIINPKKYITGDNPAPGVYNPSFAAIHKHSPQVDFQKAGNITNTFEEGAIKNQVFQQEQQQYLSSMQAGQISKSRSKNSLPQQPPKEEGYEKMFSELMRDVRKEVNMQRTNKQELQHPMKEFQLNAIPHSHITDLNREISGKAAFCKQCLNNIKQYIRTEDTNFVKKQEYIHQQYQSQTEKQQ